jgi:hypothetical protein
VNEVNLLLKLYSEQKQIIVSTHQPLVWNNPADRLSELGKCFGSVTWPSSWKYVLAKRYFEEGFVDYGYGHHDSGRRARGTIG